MLFSKACEYAIKASIFITKESLSGRRANVRAIAEATQAPEAFVAKTLQPLARNGILTSTKGQQGGFSVEPEQMNTIKLMDIIKIIDGDGLFTRCAFGLSQCSEVRPCPLHEHYKPIRRELTEMMQSFTLYDLAVKTEQGFAFLKV
ncbi:MAG: Rrf2 family transcriptional regulator [Chryseobacterium sp.]|nr:MAG: Rrf2 family transcriptional regulator [Chryseobacterium sp.]